MNNSFIFYRGFADTIKLAPPEDRLQLYEYLCGCALGDLKIEDIPYPHNLTISSMLASVEASRQRYEKAVENGKKGGRPRIWIDRVEAEKLHEELGSWKQVAEKLGVSEETLSRARAAWHHSDEKAQKEKPKQEKPKYDPNVNWAKSED